MYHWKEFFYFNFRCWDENQMELIMGCNYTHHAPLPCSDDHNSSHSYMRIVQLYDINSSGLNVLQRNGSWHRTIQKSYIIALLSPSFLVLSLFVKISLFILCYPSWPDLEASNYLLFILDQRNYAFDWSPSSNWDVAYSMCQSFPFSQTRHSCSS